MCDNHDEMLSRVSQDGLALQYASKKLRGDREIVMQAVADDGRALQYASRQLKGDREIVLQAVAEDGRAFQHASEQLRGDREIASKAIADRGWAFEYASEELRSDTDMAEAALADTRTQRAVVLKVTLLSGRSCSQIFSLEFEGVQFVLRKSARLLDMDPNTVERSGTLMIGSVAIKDLKDLEPRKVHEVTLVLS